MESKPDKQPLLPLKVPQASVEQWHFEHFDTDTFLCCAAPADPQTLSNAFVSDRLDRLRGLSRANFGLALLCLIYIGVNMVTFVINSLDEETSERYGLDLPFHLLEFWATFCFSLVEVCIIVFSPRSTSDIYRNPTFLRFIIFFNVVSSFMPATMVSFSLECFEFYSHNLEYGNEVALAFLDVVLLLGLSRSPLGTRGGGSSGSGCKTVAQQAYKYAVMVIPLTIAVLQIFVYNLDLWHKGEKWAHYLEFTFAIGSALVSFLFCMDNKALVDQIQGEMIGGWCHKCGRDRA